MVRLAEARWPGAQAGEDAVARGQALGCSLAEAGTRLSETRWRRGQDGGDAVARGQAMGLSDRGEEWGPVWQRRGVAGSRMTETQCREVRR